MNELPFPNYPVPKMSLLGRTLVTLPGSLQMLIFPSQSQGWSCFSVMAGKFKMYFPCSDNRGL